MESEEIGRIMGLDGWMVFKIPIQHFHVVIGGRSCFSLFVRLLVLLPSPEQDLAFWALLV